MASIYSKENLVTSPIKQRIPPAFMDKLTQMDAYFKTMFRGYSTSFPMKAGLLGLTLEKLYAMGAIPHASTLFDAQGCLNLEMSAVDIENARDESLLESVHIVNVGGVEALLFNIWGAHTTYVDSTLLWCSRPNFDNSRYIPHRLGPLIAKDLEGTADVVMSSLLFSRGSRMVDDRSVGMWDPVTEEEASANEEYLRYCLQMNRPGGLNIHDGEILEEVIPRVEDVATLTDVIPLYGDRPDEHGFNYYVLQKK